MTTERDSNERLALRLGWEDSGKDNIQTGKRLWGLNADWKYLRGEISQGCPDYSSWERFPELQEYVLGLPMEQQAAITAGVMRKLTIQYADVVQMAVNAVALLITPDILGAAILAVPDDE